MDGSYFRNISIYKKKGFETPIDELLEKQRKGKFLTFDEKEKIKKYSEEQRIKKLNQNKNKIK